jgi:hypothetical protein
MFTDQVFWLAVVSQQAGNQFLGDGFLYYGHLRSLGRGSFLSFDRLHKNSYTLGIHPNVSVNSACLRSP